MDSISAIFKITMFMLLLEILFVLTIAFVRTVKAVEFLFLHLVPNHLLETRFRREASKLGIALHTTDEDKESILKWKKEEEKQLLGLSGYKKVIHIEIKNKNMFRKLLSTMSMALGEGFENGDWEPLGKNPEDDLLEVAFRADRSCFSAFGAYSWNRFLFFLEFSLFNRQKRNRAWQVGKEHYDLGNDVFETFLDPWMQYTCGYWAKADNLHDAQLHKMELIACKLKLKPGMRILDLGCGWGTLCKYLAERHGVECVGVTISKEGAAYGRKVCEGLPVEIRLQDYRDVNETFDRIVSIGMLEHVGHHNQKEFFNLVHRSLKDDGIFILHCAGRNHSTLKVTRSDPWTEEYFYANGSFPYMWEVVKNTEDLFVVEDWHNFGVDYEKTLLAWRENWTNQRPSIVGKYGENFFRRWMLFFSCAAAAFKARRLQLWQIVLTKDGLLGGYRAPR